MFFRRYLYSAPLAALLVLVLGSNLQAEVGGFESTKLTTSNPRYNHIKRVAASEEVVVVGAANGRWGETIIFEKGPDGRYQETLLWKDSGWNKGRESRFGESLVISEGVIVLDVGDDGTPPMVFEKGPDGSYRRNELKLSRDIGFDTVIHSIAVSKGVIAVSSISWESNRTRFVRGPSYIHIFEKGRDGTFQETTKFEHFGQIGRGLVELFAIDKIAIFEGVIALSSWMVNEDGKLVAAVYAYEKDANGRYQGTELVISEDVYYGILRGLIVSVSKGEIVVGDPFADGPGAAYVFTKDLNGTYQKTKLMASDGVTGNNFGASVSVSEELIVVGASGDDQNGENSGAAYVYKKDRNGTYQETKLMDSDGGVKDYFGHIVSVSEGMIAVSSRSLQSGTSSIFLFESAYKKIGFSTKELDEALLELSDTTPNAYSEFYKALSSKVDELPLTGGRVAVNTNYEARSYLLIAIEPLVTGFDSDYFKEKVHASYKESLKELTEELGIESKEGLPSSSKTVGIRLDLSIEALKALKRSANNEQAQGLNDFLSELGPLKARLNADPKSYNEVSKELSGVTSSYENLLLDMATIGRNLNFVQVVQSVK